MGKRFPRLFVVLSIFLLTSLLTTSTAFSSNARNELVIISRDTQVFDKDATVLDFPITIVRFGHGVSVGEIVNFKINGNELYDKIEKSQAIDVHRIDDAIDHTDFKQWMEYRKNVSILKIRNDDELLLSMAKDHGVNLTHAINKLRDQTTGILPSPILVDVTDLPFSLSSDMILTVEITVESGKDHVTWEGEALIVDIEPLSVNPVWTPADLHLHTAFSDGAYAPSGYTTQLNSKGYKLAYIVDEPVGWGITQTGFTPKMSGTGNPATNSQLPSNRYDRLPYLATWAQYRDGVRSASTVNVGLFPGAEISASNQEFSHNGVHNGHALAYGIVNLTGSTLFDTTGLRYNWFLPNTVLKNINLNNSGVSSSSLAHVYSLFYPWNVWGSSLTERYDGMELMSAGQFNFSPSQSAMVKWRQELLHRLPGVFNNQGFPSARTGSDYDGHLLTPYDLSYYTYIGLPSLPSDMRNLSQQSVDVALREGRTIVSRLGGVAALRLKDSSGTYYEVGSRYSMPVSSIVEGDVVLRAAVTGQYRVRVIEDDFRRTVHDSSRRLNAGETVVIPISFSYPGSNRFYHTIVEHSSIFYNDTIYSSPIFIRQQ
mgnify:CR=1 FL=1|jgi:hypothetical protein